MKISSVLLYDFGESQNFAFKHDFPSTLILKGSEKWYKAYQKIFPEIDLFQSKCPFFVTRTLKCNLKTDGNYRGTYFSTLLVMLDLISTVRANFKARRQQFLEPSENLRNLINSLKCFTWSLKFSNWNRKSLEFL